MSISTLWQKILAFIRQLIGHKMDWDECTKSSNWEGSNAQHRMMNILSPRMPEAVYKERVKYIKSRGCNCVNLFLCNKGDGEYAGYSICGNNFTPGNVDADYSKTMLKRVKELYNEGYGIVLWLAADDSSAWNKTMVANAQWYVNTIKDLGFFDYASTVVIGLEVNEYWTAGQCATMANCLRQVYSGKIGIHQTSDRIDYAGLADIMFYQTTPGKSPEAIAKMTKNVVDKLNGKPLCFFELSRQADRKACDAALGAGAFSVGNY